MDLIFNAKNYKEIVEYCLHQGGSERRKGVVALAKAMRCHATFLAKVLDGRADFSLEQTLAFADHFSFSDFESQFLVDLVQRDRAGDQKTKQFFDARLDAMRQARLELSKRLGGERKVLLSEIQAEYYNSWIPQYVHIACQTTGKHTASSLAERMHVPLSVIENAVQLLTRGGLLVSEHGALKSVVDFMHLPRQSYLVEIMHQQWRLKVASDVGRNKSPHEIRFSGLMSIDKKTAEKIKTLVADCLAEMKPHVEKAAANDVFFLGIDFYEPNT